MNVMTALNDKQADLLRYLYRQTGPVPTEHLDGRVVRALKSRRYVEERNGWISVSDAGRAAFERNGSAPPVQRRRRRTSTETGASHARAHAIQRAVEMLEGALPKDAEVAVGNIFAYADDVVEALRKHARALEKRRA
jgi:hypothetical protein